MLYTYTEKNTKYNSKHKFMLPIRVIEKNRVKNTLFSHIL